jgi:hypothetical protein
VQATQLQHDQEQEEDNRAAGVQQVLSFLSQAHGAQGNEVEGGIWKLESKPRAFNVLSTFPFQL